MRNAERVTTCLSLSKERSPLSQQYLKVRFPDHVGAMRLKILGSFAQLLRLAV
jgi:hypothetical protein